MHMTYWHLAAAPGSKGGFALDASIGFSNPMWPPDAAFSASGGGQSVSHLTLNPHNFNAKMSTLWHSILPTSYRDFLALQRFKPLPDVPVQKSLLKSATDIGCHRLCHQDFVDILEDWHQEIWLSCSQAANLSYMLSLDTLMKMGSIPSLRLNESGFPSLMAQRPFGEHAPSMQGFSAASKSHK